jgi:hypothetical protein
VVKHLNFLALNVLFVVVLGSKSIKSGKYELVHQSVPRGTLERFATPPAFKWFERSTCNAADQSWALRNDGEFPSAPNQPNVPRGTFMAHHSGQPTSSIHLRKTSSATKNGELQNGPMFHMEHSWAKAVHLPSRPEASLGRWRTPWQIARMFHVEHLLKCFRKCFQLVLIQRDRMNIVVH